MASYREEVLIDHGLMIMAKIKVNNQFHQKKEKVTTQFLNSDAV
jgi:hypothetical protein